jgi:hypothetical protein
LGFLWIDLNKKLKVEFYYAGEVNFVAESLVFDVLTF